MNQFLDPARLAALRVGMARRVTAVAALSKRWQAAFASVPREAFIPAVVWRDEAGSALEVDRGTDPETWTRMLYNEYCSIVTQLDGGTGTGEGRYTSSSSMPTVMARMIAELPDRQGARVLEVGSGTGYNAAVLAARYGAENVATVEVDAALAERADKALVAAGFPAVVACGDGVDSLPQVLPGARFDALICTCSIAHLPAGWLAAVPDGVIVAPWCSGWLPVGVLTLHVREGDVTGRFKRDFHFMRARAHRWEAERPVDVTGGRERHGPLSPHRVTYDNEAAAFYVSLCLPGVDYIIDDRDGLKTLTAWDNADPQSWSVVDWVRTSNEWRVRESGPRSLWAEVEQAYGEWARLGEPGVDRYTVRIGDGGVHVTLDGQAVAELPVT